MAGIEITKGVFVMIAAAALAALLHRDYDLQQAAVSVLGFLHIDPERRYAELFVKAAGRVTDLNVLTVLGISAAYTSLRFVEGYGLWRGRIWAEWLALFSGAIYLPIEIWELVKKATPLHWAFLFTNLLVLAYIAYVRIDAIRHRGENH